MSEPHDPFEILEGLNPIDATDLEGLSSSTAARATLQSILDQPQGASEANTVRRQRVAPRRRRHIYAVAAITLAAATAGTAWALTRGAPQQITIGCYAAPSTTARTVVLGAGTTSATQVCREAWRRGDFGNTAIPRLKACMLPSGAIGVFPNLRRCTDLKLTAPTHSPSPSPSRQGSPITLKNRLVQAYLGHRCIGRAAGLHLANAQIQRLHLTGWHSRVTTPFTGQRPCTSYAFDEHARLVLIVPMPPR